MVEESELPIVDLLARNRSLVRSLAAAAGEIKRGGATQAFLRAALRSAGRADDLALLEHSSDLRSPDTLLFGLFGADIVDRASAVMVGSGNELRTGMTMDRGRLSAGTVLDDLDRIKGQAARISLNRVPEQAARVRVARVSRGRSAAAVRSTPSTRDGAPEQAARVRVARVSRGRSAAAVRSTPSTRDGAPEQAARVRVARVSRGRSAAAVRSTPSTRDGAPDRKHRGSLGRGTLPGGR